MKILLSLLSVLTFLFCGIDAAKAQDTLAVDTLLTEEFADTIPVTIADSIRPRPTFVEEFPRMTIRQMAHEDMSYAPLPLAVAGFAMWGERKSFRYTRNQLEPRFKHSMDDYIQYAPLAATVILKAAGVQGRSKWGRFLVCTAFSYGIMAGLCNGMKYSIKEMRPDGSTRNSFPSGHTATAFAAATILHKEYGLTRSPWYSVGGYAIATTTGVMRMLNNRHWVSDVLVGAAIGIVSVDLGYFIGDVIFKEKGLKRNYRHDVPDLYRKPSFFNLAIGAGFANNLDLPVGKIKAHVASMAAIEAAYFINPYVGFGGRLQVMNTPVTTDATTLSTYNGLFITNRDVLTSDQQSAFSASAGVYGSYPITRRFAVGGKLLLGRTRVGALHFDYETMENEIADDIEVKATSSFLGAVGLSLTYAYRHGFAWKLGVDYDVSCPKFDAEYSHTEITPPTSSVELINRTCSVYRYLHHVSVNASMNIMF